MLDFITNADAKFDAPHSFMLVRHGNVIAEGWWSPYSPQSRHQMFSLSKSFTSTAVGLAISEGKLSLFDPVVKFFPDDIPTNASDNLKAMRIRDLLTMSSGQLPVTVQKFSFDSKEVLTKQFLALPVDVKPGTLWFYSTPSSYMLSAIVQKVEGQNLVEYLKPRLFEPLGIDNPVWEMSPQGIALGGYGLSVRTEDIAKFGLLYLNHGKWNGKQLVPADWVAMATARQASNGSDPDSDWEQGYGFQFWRARHGLYRGDGAFGQFCIVMPEQDAVVSITSGTRSMASVMNLVWDKILPAFQPKALPANPEGDKALASTLAGLKLHMPQRAGFSALASQIAGKKYVFPTNDLKIESVGLAFYKSSNGPTLFLKCDGVEQQIRCGTGDWVKGTIHYMYDLARPAQDVPMAASGAWTADDVYTVKLAFYESPFSVTIDLHFNGDTLLFDSEYNVVRRGSQKQPELTGKAM
ncbi:MAG TPA: serine hydrolase domain-containing protein [Candidatus Angelobacter sp.]|nr:serine hydrolase domain-containing protein [Candidatus Angelobacter sp.]